LNALVQTPLYGQLCAFHTLPILEKGQGLSPLYCHSQDKTLHVQRNQLLLAD